MVQLTFRVTLLVDSAHTSPVFIPLVEVLFHGLGSINGRPSLAAEKGFVLGTAVAEDVELRRTMEKGRRSRVGHGGGGGVVVDVSVVIRFPPGQQI